MQGRDLLLELRWSFDNGTLINVLFVKFFVRIEPHWLLFEGQLTGHEFSLKLADFFAPAHTWNVELLSFEFYPNILNLISIFKCSYSSLLTIYRFSYLEFHCWYLHHQQSFSPNNCIYIYIYIVVSDKTLQFK